MKKVILVKRSDGSLVPAYQHDREIVNKLKPGEHIFSFGSRRNPRAHALTFALAKCTLDNLPEKYEHWHDMYRNNKSTTPYFFLKAIQLELGMATPYQRPDGTIGMIPKSLSFEAMSEEEFAPLLDMMMKQASKYLGITVDEMRKNYIQYL